MAVGVKAIVFSTSMWAGVQSQWPGSTSSIHLLLGTGDPRRTLPRVYLSGYRLVDNLANSSAGHIEW